jgi:hypothetical protein
MTYKNGIHIESEFKTFQDKARKFDNLVSLAKEEISLSRRKKQIGQERAKILGVTEKYQ